MNPFLLLFAALILYLLGVYYLFSTKSSTLAGVLCLICAAAVSLQLFRN